MNFKHILIVFKKEMKDSFRDKKSVLTNILLPLILIPIMYYLMNMGMKGMTKDVTENMKISIEANQQDMQKAIDFTNKNIIGQEKIEIKSYDTEEEENTALMDGDINCVISYDDNFFSNIESGKPSVVELKYNSTKNASHTGFQILESKITMLNQKLAIDKLNSMNISPDILNLISVSSVDASIELSTNGKTGNQMLMMIIPMYLVIVIVTAGVPIAIDLIAGERERNTFEALLSTKANRLSILIGKYLAILVFSIIAIIMSFLGLILGIIVSPEMFTMQAGETMGIMQILTAMNMPIGALLLALLTAITLAAVFAGIQIAISTWSKSVKEAQTYLSYMMFPAMILAFATMFMGAGDMKTYMACIPIFNTISSLKMVLGGVINYPMLLIGVIANIVFIIIVVIFIVRMFNNEKIVIK